MPHIQIIGDDGVEQTRSIPPHGLTIGRSSRCDVRLDSGSISKQHARIVPAGDRWDIEDTGSANGLVVNGARTQHHVLCDGDAIRLPHYRMTFHDERAANAAVAEELQRTYEELQARGPGAAGPQRVHPYAAASLLFLACSVLHWSFALAGALLSVLALRAITRGTQHRGRLLAVSALLGCLLLGGADALTSSDMLRQMLAPDPLETLCRENLYAIRAALERYRADHDGALPDELAVLHPDYIDSPGRLACPGSGPATPGAGYHYIGADGTDAAPDDALVVDAGADNHTRSGALALHADGQVRRLSLRQYEYLRLQHDWVK